MQCVAVRAGPCRARVGLQTWLRLVCFDAPILHVWCVHTLCSDHLFHLNFAITLFVHDERERAKAQFLEFDRLFQVGAGPTPTPLFLPVLRTSRASVRPSPLLLRACSEKRRCVTVAAWRPRHICLHASFPGPSHPPPPPPPVRLARLQDLDEETRKSDAEVLEQRQALMAALQ